MNTTKTILAGLRDHCLEQYPNAITALWSRIDCSEAGRKADMLVNNKPAFTVYLQDIKNDIARPRQDGYSNAGTTFNVQLYLQVYDWDLFDNILDHFNTLTFTASNNNYKIEYREKEIQTLVTSDDGTDSYGAVIQFDARIKH